MTNIPESQKNAIAVLYSALLSEMSLETKLVYMRNLLSLLRSAVKTTNAKNSKRLIGEIDAGIVILDGEFTNMEHLGEEATSHKMFSKLNKVQDFVTELIYDGAEYCSFEGERFTLIPLEVKK
jgi:hypothetical protein